MGKLRDAVWSLAAMLGIIWLAGGSLEAALGTLAWLQVAWLPVTVVHEGGHWFAARAVGMKVHRVVIGAGPLLLERQIGGAWIELRLFPNGGSTLVTPPRFGPLLRAQMLATLAAGPAMNLALFLVLRGLGIGPLGGGTAHGAAAALAIANTLSLVLNLVPWRFAGTGGMPLRTDGLQLLLVLFAPATQLRENVVAHHAMEAMAASIRGDVEEAHAWLDRGRALEPATQVLEMVRGNLHERAGQYALARAI